jgi:hypothetical protein
LTLVGASGDPPQEVRIAFRCRTAGSKNYPAQAAERVQVRIQFPARYPFQEPLAEIQTPIVHPNVFASGKICFGAKWIPMEGLDLLVKRIGQIITFDSELVNEASPANADALAWYRGVKARHPEAFPTDSITFLTARPKPTTATWRNLIDTAPAESFRLIRCPRCAQQLRLPNRNDIVGVRCPKCGASVQP